MAVVTPPTITPPPTRPDRADPATFANRADAWTIWERDKQVPEMGAVGANVYANATDAASSATAANTSKIAAATSATNSATSATASDTARAASVTAKTAAETAATNSANSATASDTARAAAVTARTGAETARTGAETAATNSATYRDQSLQYRNEAQAIAEGDIHGTGPTQFRNNSENDARFDPLAFTLISAVTDYNTLTTPQKVVLSGSSNTNGPTADPYYLRVSQDPSNANFVTQEATSYQLDPPQRWVRNKIGVSTWSAWSRLENALTMQTISTNTNAVAGNHYLITASLVLTLSAAPRIGDRVGFTNLSGTETASLGLSFQKIRGVTGNMTLDSTTASAVLTYSGSAQGWI